MEKESEEEKNKNGIRIWKYPEEITLEEGIKDAFKNKKLVIFLGAGVSKLIGCPSWEELSQKLVEACLIDFKLKEDILNLRDNKKILSICKKILEEKQEGSFFNELKKFIKISPEREKKNQEENKDIYQNLKKISAIILTTNYDDYLSKLYKESEIAYEPDQFDSENIEKYKLYHLHGHIAHKESVVVTVDEYLERYRNERFKAFIDKILGSGEYTILFIGYGLDEFELLDYLALLNEIHKKSPNPHFILLPYYEHQEELVNFEQTYFDTFNINIIAYGKDKVGYEYLHTIINNWKDRLNETVRLIENQEDIDEVIPTNGN